MIKPWEETASCSYQEHAESFSHDAVEEVEGGVSCHHEEVGEEEVLSAAVVQQSVVLAAKQRLIGILEETERNVHKMSVLVTSLTAQYILEPLILLLLGLSDHSVLHFINFNLLIK